MKNGSLIFMEQAYKQISFIKAKLFFSLWMQPRKAINLLLAKKMRFVHLKILTTLTFIFSLQFLAVLWSVNTLPGFIKTASQTQFVLPIALFLGLYAAISVILNLGSIIFYYFAKSLGGIGNFSHTKLAVYWSSMTTVPIGLFFVLFFWSGEINLTAVRQELDRPLFTVFLQSAAALGFFIFIVYGLIILSKMLSEIHKISTGRAFAAVFAGVISTGLIGPLIILAIIKKFA